MLRPHRPRQSSRDRYQVDYHEDQRCHFGQDGRGIAGDVDLCDGGVDDVEVEAGSEVAGGEGEEGEDHGEVEFDVAVEDVVAGLDGVEVVVFEDVEEGEQTAVDPSAALLHQVLVALHRVRPCPCVRHVLQVVVAVGLAVDAQTENPVLREVHVGLLVAAALEFGVEGHFEVAVLEEVGFVVVGFDEGLVAVGGPGAGEDVQEAETALCVFVDEVGDDVLVLLGPFD